MKFIILVILALWASGLGFVPLLDWDEANFAEVSREMLVSGDWSFVKIGFEPFWEKPPLFFWLQATSFKFFGVSEWAARFPNILVSALTFLLLYRVGLRRSAQFATILVLGFACSFLPSFYFRTGLIDPLFNLLVFFSLLSWYEFENVGIQRHLIVAILAMAAAILTKGPTALLICSSTVAIFWLMDLKQRMKIKIAASFVLYAGLSLVPYVVWMKHQGTLNQGQVTIDFLSYVMRLFSTADAGHRGFPLYHVVVLGLGCLPLSLFLLQGWKIEDPLSRIMKVLLLVVVVVFSVVQTKIIHYSSLAYFPLTYLAALAIEDSLKKNEFISRSHLAIVYIFLSLIFIVPTLIIFEPFTQWVRDLDLIQSIQEYRMNSTEGVLRLGYTFIGIALGVGGFFYSKKLKLNDLRVIGILLVSQSMWGLVIIPEIANIAQGSLISFYKRAARENVNIQSLGFKSYASYFYSRYDPKRGAPVYAVSRSRDREWAMKAHRLELLELRGGWVLYRVLR